MLLEDFINNLKNNERYGREIVHHEILESSPAMYAPLTPGLPEPLRDSLKQTGIHRLYTHQVEAINSVRTGNNVVTVTPTASGKTLNFLLPVLEAIIKDPTSHALLFFPIKALSQDQYKRIKELLDYSGLEEITVSVYDGDTPKSERTNLRRNPPNIVITNPDMLHHGMLPFHSQWHSFFRNLKYVVVDELHGYKGVFGSNVLQIFHRLRRVCKFYRSNPQFIAASATIGNPRKLAKELTGLEFEVVEKSGAPTAKRHILFVNPISSLYTSTVRLFGDSINSDLKTIVFTKARKITELIQQWTLQSNPDLYDKISAYRSGYLPKERREIETRLRSGELDGVIATSALEMGIDIGGLDVAILVGYPGTIAATWQRGGRVGRKDRDSLIILVAMPDALDQYFMRHPADFFRRTVESAVVDGNNQYLLERHLACAAQEVPLKVDETIYPPEALKTALKTLVENGDLLEAAGGAVYFPKKKQPQLDVDIRGAGANFSIFEQGTKRLIGKLSTWQAMSECHPGAVYLHHGNTYLSSELDLGRQEIKVQKKDVAYYTQTKGEKQTEILEVYENRKNDYYEVSLGKLKVTESVIGYEKRSTASREKLSDHPLDLPPVKYETIGIWFQVSNDVIAALLELEKHPMGALHAVEHSTLALLPLFAMCDRNDLGGISFTRHVETGTATIFLYDGHPGGVGLANRAYEILDELFKKVLHLVENCPCDDGCPSCIHSPKCGHGNQPLDKDGCVILLKHLTGKEKLKGNPELAVEKFGNSGTSQTVPLSEKKKAKQEKEKKSEIYINKLSKAKDRDIIVFDLETQRSAADVGGWHNAHLMRVALAVIYERKFDRYVTYFEDQVQDLIDRMREAEMIVGFNNINFDNSVLMGYSGEDLRAFNNLDLLSEIVDRNGFRVKLADLGKGTFDTPKTADGLQSLEWWKEGKIDEIEKYCQMDVQITANLFDYSLEHGHLIVNRFDQGKVKLPLELPIEKYFK
jgi:DEAD/DEAH box helicase domain-containing protein